MLRTSIGRETTLCMSLAGRPGTFGSRFHNHLYGELGLDYIYKAFTTRDLAGAMAGVRALGIRGCAVSMPFKEACIPMLDALDATAEAIDSVNTIVNDGARLTGYNTDYGAVRKLLAQHQVPTNIPFVLLGSGGMAKAVASALRDAGYRNGTVVARNRQAGRALASACGYVYQPEVRATDHDMLINVTPLGMSGADASTLPFGEPLIRRATWIFDVVASPPETPLLQQARALHKRVITGSEVIALQALDQFTLYTGVRPSEAQVAAAVRFALSD